MWEHEDVTGAAATHTAMQNPPTTVRTVPGAHPRTCSALPIASG